tara:strand:+ start:137 stop:250 length:114 start_codon:yes stop_codon:yes gene_type:complete
VDLTLGSNSQLRAISEFYACDDDEEKEKTKYGAIKSF